MTIYMPWFCVHENVPKDDNQSTTGTEEKVLDVLLPARSVPNDNYACKKDSLLLGHKYLFMYLGIFVYLNIALYPINSKKCKKYFQ